MASKPTPRRQSGSEFTREHLDEFPDRFTKFERIRSAAWFAITNCRAIIHAAELSGRGYCPWRNETAFANQLAYLGGDLCRLNAEMDAAAIHSLSASHKFSAVTISARHGLSAAAIIEEVCSQVMRAMLQCSLNQDWLRWSAATGNTPAIDPQLVRLNWEIACQALKPLFDFDVGLALVELEAEALAAAQTAMQQTLTNANGLEASLSQGASVLVTVKEASDATGRSEGVISKWANDGKILATGEGKSRLVSAESAFEVSKATPRKVGGSKARQDRQSDAKDERSIGKSRHNRGAT